jgi:hypothetical protein
VLPEACPKGWGIDNDVCAAGRMAGFQEQPDKGFRPESPVFSSCLYRKYLSCPGVSEGNLDKALQSPQSQESYQKARKKKQSGQNDKPFDQDMVSGQCDAQDNKGD